MDFREMAIQAHHKVETEMRLWRQGQAIEFAERAAKMFRRRIIDVPVKATAIEPRRALIKMDGIEIDAREEYDAVEFYTFTTCPVCEEESSTRTPTLADIGYVLENKRDVCKNCDI